MKTYQARKELLKSVRLNRPAVVLAAIVTAASLVTYIFQLANSEVTRTFQLSPATPWGIFTSIFLHSSLEHLLANIGALWIFTSYILLSVSLAPDSERKGRAVSLVPVVIGSAVIADALWALVFQIVNPNIQFASVGASGIVYAVGGSALGFAIADIQDAIAKARTVPETPHKKIKGVILVNAIVVGFFLSMLLAAPDIFLSKAPGSNVFVHGIAFLMAFGLVMTRKYITSLLNTGNLSHVAQER
ncbi:MAG TPA: rhomboid family intramembrane serine protease [Nitrososphaera sp.]|jgi:membrane associated rhomboid family serine protease